MRQIVGYAALFDSESVNLGGFTEQIQRGAFSESIKHDDIRLLWNHDQNYVLARNKSKTLSLEEDSKGLKYRATPPDAQWAKDLMKSIERGDINQNSFGFTIERERWVRRSSGTMRILEQCRLHDVSPCTFPAYEGTQVWLEGY